MSTRLSLICHAAMPVSDGPMFWLDGPADPAQLAKIAPWTGIDRLWSAPEDSSAKGVVWRFGL